MAADPEEDIQPSVPLKKSRGGGAPTKTKGGLTEALYFHVSLTLLQRLDAYVQKYGEKIKIRISRADVIRKIIEAELDHVDRKAEGK